MNKQSLAALALLAATACAGPTWYEAAQREGAPIYTCALSHTIGRDTANVTGFYRADGSAVFEPKVEGYWLGETEPALVAKLAAHFAALARDPVANCSPYEGEEGTYREHSFDCSDSWREGEEHFTVETNRIGWRMERDGQRVMSLGWTLVGRTDFAVAGFPWGESLGPSLMVERPRDFGRANSRIFDKSGKRLIEDRYHESGEVRAGERVYRSWSASNSAFSIPWGAWPQLHETGQPITVTLHDSELGLTYDYDLPADFPRTIEAKLKRAHAQLKERERDPVNRCTAVENLTGGPVIILTH